MNNQENLKEIAYEAFVYAYPMLEQVKTINAMMEFSGLAANKPAMVPKLPMETAVLPPPFLYDILAINLIFN